MNRRINERVDLLFDEGDLNVLVSGFDGGEESLNGGDTGKGTTDDDHLDKFCCLCHCVFFMRVERELLVGCLFVQGQLMMKMRRGRKEPG